MILDTPPAYADGSLQSTGIHMTESASENVIRRRPSALDTGVRFDREHLNGLSSHSVSEKPPLEQPSSPYEESESGEPTATMGMLTPSAQSYNGDLPLEEARCSLLPHHSAAWIVKGKGVQLSTLSAAVLLNEGLLKANTLKLFNSYQQHPDAESLEPSNPISGVLSAAHGTVGGVIQGIADYPIEVTRMIKQDKSVAQAMATDFALDKGKGVSRIVGSGLKAPMDVTMGLAKGFHNMPKAYGDEVRAQERVTGWQSGLKVAGKGLGYGLYDGISGFFVQPVKGAQKGGVLGFLGGVGKGIGGIVCKPVAGACGLPAYAFKGIYEEFHKKRGFNIEDHMVATLTAQGQMEFSECSTEERMEVLQRWYEFLAMTSDSPVFVKYQ